MKKTNLLIVLIISIILIACNNDPQGTTPTESSTDETEETTEQTTDGNDQDSDEDDSDNEDPQDDIVVHDGLFSDLTADLSGATSIAIGFEDGVTSGDDYTLIKMNENGEREEVTFTDLTGQRVIVPEKPYLVEVIGNFSFIVYEEDYTLETTEPPEPTLLNFRKQHYKYKNGPSNLYFAMLIRYFNDMNLNFVAIHNETGTVFSLSTMARKAVAEGLEHPSQTQDSMSSASNLINGLPIADDYFVQDDTIYIISDNPVYSDITTISVDSTTKELIINTYKNEDDTFLPQTLYNNALIYVTKDYKLHALSSDLQTNQSIDLNLCSLYTIDPCSEEKLDQQSFKIRGAQKLNNHLYINLTSEFESAIIVLDEGYKIINSKSYFPGDLGTPYIDLFISHDALYFVDDQSYLMELNPESLSIEEAHKISNSWQGSLYDYRTEDYMYFFSENDIKRYDFTSHEIDTIGTLNDITDEYIECLIDEEYQNFYFETGEFITKEVNEHPVRTIKDIEPLN